MVVGQYNTVSKEVAHTGVKVLHNYCESQSALADLNWRAYMMGETYMAYMMGSTYPTSHSTMDQAEPILPVLSRMHAASVLPSLTMMSEKTRRGGRGWRTGAVRAIEHQGISHFFFSRRNGRFAIGGLRLRRPEGQASRRPKEELTPGWLAAATASLPATWRVKYHRKHCLHCTALHNSAMCYTALNTSGKPPAALAPA